jgi:hypothetical protein
MEEWQLASRDCKATGRRTTEERRGNLFLPQIALMSADFKSKTRNYGAVSGEQLAKRRMNPAKFSQEGAISNLRMVQS